MKKLTLTLLLFVFLAGCKATKNVEKTKKETSTEQEIDTNTKGVKITEEIQEGGNASIPIIPVEERERDDLGELKEMVRELKQGNATARVKYNRDGTADCECDVEFYQKKIIDIYEKQEEERNKRDEVESNKIKEESFEVDNVLILYLVIGLTVAMLGAMIVVTKKISVVYNTVDKINKLT